MTLRRYDLKDIILSKISIDQFEPKTGSLSDVTVLGFYLSDLSPARDLYEYLNASSIKFRDIEVSPNPNPDNYYMVFVEIDRNTTTFDMIKDILNEVSNLSGNFAWKAKVYDSDSLIDITDEELPEYILRGPQTPEPNMKNEIQEFLSNSDLTEASVNAGVITLCAGNTKVKMDLVDFGKSNRVMHMHNLNEAAISNDFDPSLMRLLNRMLGEMAAVAIDRKIIIYNPNDESKILVTTAR